MRRRPRIYAARSSISSRLRCRSGILACGVSKNARNDRGVVDDMLAIPTKVGAPLLIPLGALRPTKWQGLHQISQTPVASFYIAGLLGSGRVGQAGQQDSHHQRERVGGSAHRVQGWPPLPLVTHISFHCPTAANLLFHLDDLRGGWLRRDSVSPSISGTSAG